MLLTRLLYSVVGALGVRKCYVCREPISKDACLCAPCYEAYLLEKKWECGICGMPLSECLCSNAYLSSHGIKRMIKLYRYRPDSENHRLNLLLYRLKRSYVRGIHVFLAEDLAAAVRRTLPSRTNAVVVSVPRTPRAKRKYGFDQSACLGKALAEEMGIPYLAALAREKRARAQKKLRGVTERESNVRDSYRLLTDESLKGRTVLLLDDTVTTGASMAECARMLRRLGAREIIAVSPFISFRHPNLFYEQKKNTREEVFVVKK